MTWLGRAAAGVLMISALLLASAPVQGAAVLDGIYARFPAQGMGGGAIVLDPWHLTIRYRIGIVGLAPRTTIRITGRSTDCAGIGRHAYRVMELQLRTDAQGALFATGLVETRGIGDIVSMRLAGPSGARISCVPARFFTTLVGGNDRLRDPSIPPPPTRAAAITTGIGDGHGLVLVETLPSGAVRITAATGNLAAGQRYALRGATTDCAVGPDRNSRVFTIPLDGAGAWRLTDRTVTTATPGVPDLRSLRIVDRTTRARWGCGNAEMIGILPG